jgi:hypothetical protein
MKGRINEPLSERPTSYAGWRRRNSVNGLRNSSAGWMMRRFAMRCLRRAVHHDREWRERSRESRPRRPGPLLRTQNFKNKWKKPTFPVCARSREVWGLCASMSGCAAHLASVTGSAVKPVPAAGKVPCWSSSWGDLPAAHCRSFLLIQTGALAVFIFQTTPATASVGWAFRVIEEQVAG